MPLTDTALRNAKPQEKPVKLFDGDGLFLLVTSTGWRRQNPLQKEFLALSGIHGNIRQKP